MTGTGKKKTPKKKAKRVPSTLPEIRTQGDPETQTPGGSLELEYREGFGYLWPDGVAQPGRWHVRTPVPCPKCNLVRGKSGHQAVIAKSIDRRTEGGGVAYLFCRGCGHRFKLPITLM